MANGADAHPKEIEFRRRWYEAHRRQAEAEPDYEEFSAWLPEFRARAADVFPLRDRLAADGDLDRFRSELRTWAQTSGVIGFKGLSGSGFVNTLVKRTDDRAELARLLADGLTAPQDRSAAAAKLGALVEHIERVKVGSHPAPGNVPFLLSFFWGMDQEVRWPILWPGTREFLELMTGLQLPGLPIEHYLRFVDFIEELDDDSDRFMVTADWWEMRNPVILDSVLVDRSAFGSEDHPEQNRRNNTVAMVKISEYYGRVLKDELAEAVDCELNPAGSKGPSRKDMWVDWRSKDWQIQSSDLELSGPDWAHAGISFRLWVNDQGAGIGIRPRLGIEGWINRAAEVMDSIEGVEGFRMLANQGSSHGEDVGLAGRAGGFFYARWYEPDELADLDLRQELIDVAIALQPIRESLIAAAYEYVGWAPTDPIDPDPIDKAAEELLVDRSFLDDIVELLKDKGQVILYGPPGTGKTYLAKRLAEALVPDSGFRGLVQFHPSTSYEDFFEGYRPVLAADGGIGYELTRGPLARMAAHAEEHSGRHLMVIDEINRANLPRVLGELLFLFEYRGERVLTLYRPDEEFGLPDSVWFVGTMNTADRSIALVDAALRRRFHFVPFFPGRGPTVGLLGRWLEREKQPGWVDGLVKMVNGELTEAVGEDLQLGFSHFMRKGYGQEPSKSDETLRRIWEYNIEPFVEDQLFGDQERIERFRFEKVIARYRSKLKPGGSPEDGADGGGSDEAQPG